MEWSDRNSARLAAVRVGGAPLSVWLGGLFSHVCKLSVPRVERGGAVAHPSERQDVTADMVDRDDLERIAVIAKVGEPPPPIRAALHASCLAEALALACSSSTADVLSFISLMLIQSRPRLRRTLRCSSPASSVGGRSWPRRRWSLFRGAAQRPSAKSWCAQGVVRRYRCGAEPKRTAAGTRVLHC